MKTRAKTNTKKRVMAPKKDTPTNVRLKRLRDATGKTQAEFGKEYFGVSSATYVRYESTKYHKQLPGPVQFLIELYEAGVKPPQR